MQGFSLRQDTDPCSEINASINGQLVFDKEPRTLNEEKTISSTNGAGITGHSHIKERN